MAVSIDKKEHVLLMARLEMLIEKAPDPEQWQEQKEELLTAYVLMHRLLEEIEQSASYYRKLNAKIRPKVAEELRRMKKAEKQSSCFLKIKPSE
ncbi:hypothetical protein ACS126_03710 [Sphingobacterium lactis]